MIRVNFDEVRRHISAGDLLGPLSEAFRANIETPDRLHYTVGNAGQTLLVMPAWRPGGDIGVKIATVFPGSPALGMPAINGEFLLFSGRTGGVRAVIDSRALTLIRTAAVSALAADRLAPHAPKTLLVVGTGPLAGELAHAHCLVRSYTTVLVWGRSPDKAARLVNALVSAGMPSRRAHTLEAAAGEADVIVCATAAEKPLIRGHWLKRPMHLNLMGSYTPGMREADDDCFRGASIVVDTPDTMRQSGDLLGPLESGAATARDIRLLGQVLMEKATENTADVSIFKSVGSALADLAAAELIMAALEQTA